MERIIIIGSGRLTISEMSKLHSVIIENQEELILSRPQTILPPMPKMIKPISFEEKIPDFKDIKFTPVSFDIKQGFKRITYNPKYRPR